MPKPRKLWFQNIVDKNFSGTIASILFITRCAGLIFGNMMIMQCVGVVGMLAQIVGVPILASVATATAVLLGAVGFQLSRTPGAGMGARGSRGDGKPELSLEALRDLMAEPDDGGGSSYADPNFRFLEVSVQETLDNKLIMLHHLDEKNLKRAFPRKGANIEVFEELERDLATNVEKLTAGELTAAQLQSLNYYGQDRVRVATLEEYLAECQKVGMQKPLAIELRHVYSDKARAALVRIAVDEGGLVEGAYTGLGGPVSIVADPGRFTSCFGEFGTMMWAHWATRFRDAEVPTRLRCCHWIDLGFMAPATDL